jgi:type III pantothenate kinase
MLLAIDVGNTNIVYGLFDGEKLVHQFRVESSRGRTADA